MDFPVSNFSIQTFSSANFLEHLFHIITVKVHLHYFHVAGEIHGYSHDLCNHKVREKRNFISCIAHNLFGFDINFEVKGIRLSAWKTANINIEG